MKQQGKYSIVLILLTILSGLGIQANAQDEGKQLMVDTVNLNMLPDLKYIQVVGVMTKGKLIVEVDYGVKLPAEKRLITDSTGNAQRFNSIVNVLNFLDRNDWEFLNAFEIKSVDGKAYHFLLRRKGTQAMDLTKK